MSRRKKEPETSNETETSGVDLLWARLDKIEKKLDAILKAIIWRQAEELKEILKS